LLLGVPLAALFSTFCTTKTPPTAMTAPMAMAMIKRIKALLLRGFPQAV
jgi:hypothetical protein